MSDTFMDEVCACGEKRSAHREVESNTYAIGWFCNDGKGMAFRASQDTERGSAPDTGGKT